MTQEQIAHLQNAIKADATLREKHPADLLTAISQPVNPMAGVTAADLQTQLAAMTKDETIQAFRYGAQEAIRLLQAGGTWDQSIAAVQAKKPA